MVIAPQSAIDAMAAWSDANLPFTCVVQAPGTGVDERGAPTKKTYTDAFTTVCRVAPMAEPKVELVADALQARTHFLVTFPRGTPIAEDHRLIISGTIAGAPFTMTLEVMGVRGPRANEIGRSVEAKMIGIPA